MQARRNSGQGAIIILVLVALALCAVAAAGAYLMTSRQTSVTATDDLATLPSTVAELREEVRQLQDEVRELRQAPMQVASRSLDESPMTSDPEAVPITDGEEGDRERGDRGRRDDGFGRGGFDPDVRKLRDLEDDQERLALARELMQSDNPMTRMAALETLVELSPGEAAAAVEQFIEDMGDDRRGGWMASRAVGMLAEAEGTSADLYRIYESTSGETQLAAARALAEQGDSTLMDRQVAGLLPSLQSADGGVQLRAIDDLGRTRSAVAVPYLTPYLSDANSEVRLRTLDALRRTGDQAVLTMIEPLLNDPVAQVRDRAERVMDDIREGDTGDFGRGGRGFGGRGGR